jgi:hypothetical protein
MRTKVLTTALGTIVVVHPLEHPNYGLSHFDKNGQWQAMTIYNKSDDWVVNKALAKKARTDTFRSHRRIAKLEYDKRWTKINKLERRIFGK